MPIEYINRCGVKYYLLQGKTKTGKPKYYASRKPDGIAAQQMPQGFEFYENPEQGLVVVRKIRSTKILPQEHDELKMWMQELSGAEHFIIDVQDDSLVVHTPGENSESVTRMMDELYAGLQSRKEEKRAWYVKRMNHVAMLRFALVDEEQRLFSAERWCFRGAIDRWIFLAGAKSLQQQARKFLPHVCKESFFDLM